MDLLPKQLSSSNQFVDGKTRILSLSNQSSSQVIPFSLLSLRLSLRLRLVPTISFGNNSPVFRLRLERRSPEVIRERKFSSHVLRVLNDVRLRPTIVKSRFDLLLHFSFDSIRFDLSLIRVLFLNWKMPVIVGR